MRFQVLGFFDDEYNGYVIDVPELPGCMSQGKTVDEAIENVKDAIKGVLRTMERIGEPRHPSAWPVFLGEVTV